MAATTFYVDGDGNFAATQTGAIDSAFGGPYGLQKAIDTSAAGASIVYAKATACRQDRLVKYTCGSIAGLNWAVGDALVQKGDSTGVWNATLCEIIDNTHVVIELWSNDFYADVSATDGIANTTQANSVTTSAKAVVSLDLDVATPAVGARLSIIGCKDDAGWTVEGGTSRFVLMGGPTYAGRVVGQAFTMAGADYWTLANFEIKFYSTYGINWGAGAAIAPVFENLYIHDIQYDGLVAYACTVAQFIRCRFEACGRYGIDFQSATGIADGCEAIGNSDTGFYQSYTSVMTMLNCISHGNTLDGVMSKNLTMIGCVVDGNLRHGISLPASGDWVILKGCRVTNNGNATGEYGLNIGNAGAYAFLRHCLFTGNDGDGNDLLHDVNGTAGNATYLDVGTGVASPGTNIMDGDSDLGDGYTAAHDWNLTDEARLRAVADVLSDS